MVIDIAPCSGKPALASMIIRQELAAIDSDPGLLSSFLAPERPLLEPEAVVRCARFGCRKSADSGHAKTAATENFLRRISVGGLP